jgi:hypothetical protein
MSNRHRHFPTPGKWRWGFDEATLGLRVGKGKGLFLGNRFSRLSLLDVSAVARALRLHMLIHV